MKDSSPLVSVIIPVYNTRQEYLSECLDSLKNQTYPNVEVIIVDDGSDDATATYLDNNWASEGWNIIHQKASGGNAARNRGYQESTGKYIIWLDADDIFNPRLVERAVELIEGKNADIGMWRFETFNSKTGEVSPSWLLPYSDVLPETILKQGVFNWRDVKESFYQILPWNAWTKVFSRTFIENHTLSWNEELSSSQDMDFCGRALVLAEKISWTEDVLVKYRMHTGIQVSEVRKDPLTSFKVAVTLKAFLEEKGIYYDLKESFAKRIPDDILYYLKESDQQFSEQYAEIRTFLQSVESNPINAKDISDRILKHPDVSRYFGTGQSVSIVIPVYGVEKYLAECLDSVLSQTYENIEVILVDDKTPDRSGDIADEYASRDGRVKVIHKPENQGLNMARATGYAASTGELVTFIDSDDRILPDYIQKMVQAYAKTGADITMCGYIFYDADLAKPLDVQPITQHDVLAEPIVYTRDQMIHFYLTQWDNWQHNNNTTTTCCKLFTREVLDSIDWEQTDYSLGEDDFETVYTFSSAKTYAVINDQMYLYRANPDSISNSKKFIPKYRGMPVSVFEICHNFEKKALELFGNRYRNEVYYRVYTMYRYYIALLLNKESFDLKDLEIFDKFFPTKELRKVHTHAVEVNMLNQVENGGLFHYLINQLQSENKASQLRIFDLKTTLANKDSEILCLKTEISSHLGIKRSARLLAGNVKRRVNGAKG